MERLSARIVYFVLVVFVSTLPASPQDAQNRQLFTQDPVTGIIRFSASVSPRDSIVQLPHEFLQESSEQVQIDSILLSKSTDYEIHYRTGVLHLLTTRDFPDTSARLMITYRQLPLAFKPSYFRHQLVVRHDSLGQTAAVVSPASRFSTDDLFGPGLQKSGSIFRGLTVASNRDLSLSSGFRMQLSGKLSEDVDVVAALTDENSPIQPEGTTQTLQEVDKVFIELNHPSYNATLGDFNIEPSASRKTEFGKLFRKVQGARGMARLGRYGDLLNESSISLTAASPRGKFHTNQFQGIEGAQGPYRLTGKNGERRIIVVAGTERVYLNGELMTRGETQDYVIDYAAAELHFTPKRLITNASRINIDFEYTDRQYARNIVVGTTDAQLMSKQVSVAALVLQEADDPDAPLDFSLDDQSRAILRASGADRFKAALNGVRFVGRDPQTGLSKGQYALRDTLIGGRTYSILVHLPGDSLALYSASFSIVETMPADSAGYDRVGVGHFRFAGIGKGNYLAVQFLPMPQQHRFADVVTTAKITDELHVSAEYAASAFDRNRFSDLDNAGSSGGAFKIDTRYSPKSLKLGGTHFGSLELSLKKRFVDRRFVAPDRFNEIEFSRKWDVDISSAADEDLQEAQLAYRPTQGLSIGGGYGTFERSGSSKSSRAEASLEARDEALPKAEYKLESIKSRNQLIQSRASWLRQRGDAEYTYGLIVPGLRVEHEDRKQTTEGSDSSHAGSFRNLEIAPRIRLLQWGPLNGSAEFQIRSEDSALAGRRERALNSTTQLYSLQLRDWNSLTSSLNLSIRRATFTETFRLRGNSNSEVILVRSLSRYSPTQRNVEVETFYEFSSQRSARQERVFVRVARGSGNYRYKGDLNNNNAADDDEFELTRFDGDYVVVYVPSDQLYPIVDLKASSRLRLNGDRLFAEDNSTFTKIVRSLSTETYLRVDERSNDPLTHRVYLIQLGTFQNPQTTISGSNQIQQDLHVFENKPDLSFRFRYNQRQGLIQFVSATERSLMRERSVRIRSQLLPEIGNITEYAHKVDRVSATTTSIRERDLLSNIVSSDFSYRPLPRWEVGFRFDVTRTVDQFNRANATADINEQSVRLVYAMVGFGQLRSEIEREEVVVSNVGQGHVLPYEFTGGRVIGKSFLWQVAFDYRITQNIQVTLNYNGRSEGNRSRIHTARAEARAFF